MAAASIARNETVKALREEKHLLPDLSLIASNYLQPTFYVTGPIHFQDYTLPRGLGLPSGEEKKSEAFGWWNDERVYPMAPGLYTFTSLKPGYLEANSAEYVLHSIDIDPVEVLASYHNQHPREGPHIMIDTLKVLNTNNQIIGSLVIRDTISSIEQEAKTGSIILWGDTYNTPLEAVDQAGGEYLEGLTLRDLNQLFYPYTFIINRDHDCGSPQFIQPIEVKDLQVWFRDIPAVDFKAQERPMYMFYNGLGFILSEDPTKVAEDSYDNKFIDTDKWFNQLPYNLRYFVELSNAFSNYSCNNLHPYFMDNPELIPLIEEVYDLVRYRLFLGPEELDTLTIHILSDSQVQVNGVNYAIDPSFAERQERINRVQEVLPVHDVSNLTLQYLRPI